MFCDVNILHLANLCFSFPVNVFDIIKVNFFEGNFEHVINYYVVQPIPSEQTLICLQSTIEAVEKS